MGLLGVDVGVPWVFTGHPRWRTWTSHEWTRSIQGVEGRSPGGHGTSRVDTGPSRADMGVPGPLLPVATSARSIRSRTFMPEGWELWGDGEGVAPALGGPRQGGG